MVLDLTQSGAPDGAKLVKAPNSTSTAEKPLQAVACRGHIQRMCRLPRNVLWHECMCMAMNSVDLDHTARCSPPAATALTLITAFACTAAVLLMHVHQLTPPALLKQMCLLLLLLPLSVPRLRPADGSEVSIRPPHEVDDANFKKLVAIIRIAVPYTGMILSTRESPQMRDELLQVNWAPQH